MGLSAAAPATDMSTQVGAGSGGGPDEVGVAVTVDRGGRDAAGSDETVYGGDDGVDSGERGRQTAGIADIAGHDHDAIGEVRGPLRVACQYPHLGTSHQ